ncbi:peptide deformylase [Thermophagus sp. OGC60D27]|uniref:peptide deformylase n=1 Tax=Thermophagus sp. OGC60D27 TaxID=3458415 RepID=UPI004038331C
MIYPIVVYGHPVLRKEAADFLPEEKGELKQLVEDMYETMYKAEGIGLAGPQIGLSKRIFVIDATPMAEDLPELAEFKKVFINARIIERDGEPVIDHEGCLSLPGISEEVSRPSRIKIRYVDIDFNEHEEIFNGWAARVVQHEYDHIQGILFVDHLAPLKKRLLKRKLNAISKGKLNVNYRIKVAK